MLPREFYLRDVFSAAPDLLGKILVRRTPEGVVSGRIAELEIYAGTGDRGSHSWQGRPTPRTAVQFGPGGHAYVYLIYGMHGCFNVVTGREGRPQVVLIRALEPLEGIELMKRRRNTEDVFALCSGPGKLCAALDITRAQNGADLCGEELFLEDAPLPDPEQIMTSPRINIDYAGECRDYPWRLYLKGSPYVSRVPKRYRDAAVPWIPGDLR